MLLYRKQEGRFHSSDTELIEILTTSDGRCWGGRVAEEPLRLTCPAPANVSLYLDFGRSMSEDVHPPTTGRYVLRSPETER